MGRPCSSATCNSSDTSELSTAALDLLEGTEAVESTRVTSAARPTGNDTDERIASTMRHVRAEGGTARYRPLELDVNSAVTRVESLDVLRGLMALAVAV